jgi:uncharacterized repeat protein (TIGR03803 family)
MKTHYKFIFACFVMLLIAFSTHAQKKIWGTLENSVFNINLDGSGFEKVMYETPGSFFGGSPTGLIRSNDGSILTLGYNGSEGAFTMFKISSTGVSTLHFWDYPGAQYAIENNSGNLIGTGMHDWFDSYYKFTIHSDTSYSQNDFSLLNFTPKGGLIKASNGLIYGLSSGGNKDTRGYIYRVDDATVTIVKYLSDKVGRSPDSRFTDGNDGFLYAPAQGGGASSHGSIFKFSIDAKRLLNVYDLTGGVNGSAPFGEMVLDAAGNLYGMTKAGGMYDKGVIYKINKNGTGYTVLHHFNNEMGAGYLALDGNNLYGNGEFGVNSNGFLFTVQTNGIGYHRTFTFPNNDHEYTTPINRLLIIDNAPTPVVQLTNPANNATDVVTSGIFVSGVVNHAAQYQLQLSLTSNFTTIAQTFNCDSNFFYVNGLNYSTTYYARVKTNVLPGFGATTSFTTAVAPGKVLMGVVGDYGGSIYHIKPDGSDFTDYFHPAFDDVIGGSPRDIFKLKDGSVLGVTDEGGINGGGSLIKIDANGITKLVDWDGYTGGLRVHMVEANDGFIYGVGAFAVPNKGRMFKIKPDGSEYASHITTDYGFISDGNLMVASNGIIYGMSRGNGPGWVYRMRVNLSGVEQMFTFSTATGKFPEGGLIEATPGYLYGLCSGGGQYNKGTLFKLSFESQFIKLHDFNGTGGATPTGDLLLDGSVFYGMTSAGGQFGNGTIFKIDVDGSGFNILHHFNGADGAGPSGHMVLENNILYGYANGGTYDKGVLFSMHTDGSAFTKLHEFPESADYTRLVGNLLMINSFNAPENARVAQSALRRTFNETTPATEIYPNPFEREFSLQVKGESSSVASVIILDMQGKAISDFSANTNQSYRLGDALSSGMYVLKITTDKGTKIYKVCKK